MSAPRMLLCLPTLSLALHGCATRPPVPAIAPYGDHWIMYNQSYFYNYASATSSTSTYSYGNVTVTTTTTTTIYTEVDKVNEGSYANPSEPPRCEGFGWVHDCPAFAAVPLAAPAKP